MNVLYICFWQLPLTNEISVKAEKWQIDIYNINAEADYDIVNDASARRWLVLTGGDMDIVDDM